MKADSSTNIKNNFGAFLDHVKRGETVLILEYGRPVAQITKAKHVSAETSPLASLEREGSVSLPNNPPLEVTSFLSSRPKLSTGVSLLDSLMSEREESQ